MRAVQEKVDRACGSKNFEDFHPFKEKNLRCEEQEKKKKYHRTTKASV